ARENYLRLMNFSLPRRMRFGSPLRFASKRSYFAHEADGVLDGRIRHWVYVEELGRYLRVIKLDDGERISSALAMRFEYFAETDTLYIQLQDVVLDFDDA